MAKVKKITVTYQNREVKVDPETAEINWEDPTKESEVEWDIQSKPRGLEAKIMWSAKGSPFEEVAPKTAKKSIAGRKNKKKGGVYEYALLFVDPVTKKVKHGIDPKIKNDPPYDHD